MENLSDEIFFEICDYLNALDIFVAFASLNIRISSILRSISLRVNILPCYCRRQIEILSGHLTFHANQVIALSINDTIRDRSSVITFLFSRHTFVNLRSCSLYAFDLTPGLRNKVIEKLQCLTKLVSIRVIQPIDNAMRATDKRLLSKTILTCMSPTLRSIILILHFDHSEILTMGRTTSNLTSLNLIFSGLFSTSSVLHILRSYRLLQRLRVAYVGADMLTNSHAV